MSFADWGGRVDTWLERSTDSYRLGFRHGVYVTAAVTIASAIVGSILPALLVGFRV